MLFRSIELLAVHMNKCSNQTQFQFNKNENILFYSMENFIRQILTKTQTRNQRLAICFNVLELCLLFVNEKVDRIKQVENTKMRKTKFEFYFFFFFRCRHFSSIYVRTILHIVICFCPRKIFLLIYVYYLSMN